MTRLSTRAPWLVGLFAVNSGAAVSSSAFTGNVATASGAALYIASGPGAVTGSTFAGNSSGAARRRHLRHRRSHPHRLPAASPHSRRRARRF